MLEKTAVKRNSLPSILDCEHWFNEQSSGEFSPTDDAKGTLELDLIIRFLIGGLVVTAFAMIGDLLKPKSFAGLFGAAPSVALATLGLTVMKHGKTYAALEARSMVLGAAALFVYCALVTWLLKRVPMHALAAASSSLLAWFAAAFGFWYAFLK